MNFTDREKELLLSNAPVLSRITLYDTDGTVLQVFNEDDYIVDWEYEDYRYVPDQGFIGQFVERLLDGHFMNIPDEISLEDKEIDVEIAVVDNELEEQVYHNYGRFVITKIEKGDVSGSYKFEASDYTKRFNSTFVGYGVSYPCLALELLSEVCDEVNVSLNSNKNAICCAVGENGITAGNYYFEYEDNCYEFTLDDNLNFRDSLMLIVEDNKLIQRKVDSEYNVSEREIPYVVSQSSTYTLLTSNNVPYVDFVNNNFVIENNQFEETDTCRNVVCAIAKLGYTWARIGVDNKLHLDFVKKSTSDVDEFDEIDTDMYYETKVTGDTISPVNKVLIGMSNVDGENIYAEQRSDEIRVDKICGASNQNTLSGGTPSPNPNYPQNINTVTGGNTVNIIGKSVLKQGYSFDSYTNPTSLALKPGSTSSRGGMNLVRNEDQSISISGTTTGDPAQVVYGIGKLGLTTWYNYNNAYILPAGTYKVVWEFSNSANVSILFWKYNENGDYIGSQTIKAINSTDTSGVGELVVDGKTVTALGLNSGQSNVVTPVTAKLMVVKNDITDLTYEPYKETSYEIDLGKNLFDKANIQYGKAWNNSSNSNLAICYVPCKPNTTYTVSFSGVSDIEFTWVEKISDEATTRTYLNGFNSTRTFTTTSTSNVICIQMNKTNIGPSDTENLKMQIEEGPVATSYAPYYRVSKNLFNKDNANIISCYLDNSGKLQYADIAKSIYIPCLPNTTYTISKVASERFRVATTSVIPDTNVNDSDYLYNDSGTSITITTNHSARYLVAWVYRSTSDTLTLQQILNTLQIEEGSTATTYEPYDKHIELCKIGDYQDYITKNTGANIFKPTLTYGGTDITCANCTCVLNEDAYVLTANGSDIWIGGVLTAGLSFDDYPNRGVLYPVNNANKIYTYCTNPLFTKNYITWYDEDKISLGYVNMTGQSSNTTPPNNAKYFTFRFGYGSATSGTRYKNRVMVSYSHITDYEPYGKNEWYEYHNVGKVILDGSESWNLNGDTRPTTNAFTTNITGKKNGDTNFITNMLTINTQNVDEERTIGRTNDNRVEILLLKTRCNYNIQSLQTWLNTNNIIVYYQLATPEIKKITYKPLIDQLNAVEKMNSYEGKTYITSRGIEVNAPIDITVTDLDQDTTSYTNNTDYEITGHEYEESAIQIFDNPLTYTEELRRIAINGSEKLYGLTYTPMSIESIGHPWLEGDAFVKLTNLEEDDLFSYPFDRKIKYNGALTTDLSSQAENEVEQKYENKNTVLDRLHHTEISVDKANQKIESIVQEVTDSNEKVSKVTQDVSGISTQIESINKSVDDNIKDIATIQETIAGLSVETSVTGGTNLIKNSVGYFGNDFWMVSDDTEGNVKTQNDMDVKNNSISANALLLQNETIYQKITEIKNGSYYISFRYKRILSTATCKLIINGKEFNLTSATWKDEGSEIPVTSNNIQISLVSNKNDSCLITDLMVSNGTSKVSWTQNSNETYTDGVKIGKGITITATGSDTELSATASSIDIVNTRNRESTSTFDKYGIKTNSLESKGTIRIADKLIISRVGDQMWISTL